MMHKVSVNAVKVGRIIAFKEHLAKHVLPLGLDQNIRYIKSMGVLVVRFRYLKLKSVLVSLRVFSLKRFTAEAFVVPFRALS